MSAVVSTYDAHLPPPPPATLVRGGFTYTGDSKNQVFPSGSVLVIGKRIAAVGTVEDVDDAVERLDATQRQGLHVIHADTKLVLPGFVNAHWHEGFTGRFHEAMKSPDDAGDPVSPFALGGDICQLSRTFDAAYGLHELIGDDEALAIARYSLWTQLRSGTTTIADVGSINHPEALVAALHFIGIRGVVSVWASDAMCVPGEPHFRRTRDADSVLARIESLLRTCAEDETARVRAMPSAIYVPNMSDQLGAGLRTLSERFDTPVATHLAALENEATVVEKYFGSRPIRRFADLGLLSDRLIAVHCAFADADERQMLLEAGVHISHAPAKYGTSGESQLSRTKLIIDLWRAGLGVSLSTDGEANPLGGMPEAMRQAWLAHNEVWSDNTTVKPTDALAMATRMAAEGVRWDDEVGSLEPGKQADLVLVDISDWRYLLSARPLENFLKLGGSSDVETVMVAGRVLVDGGRATFTDEDELERDFVAALWSLSLRLGEVDTPTLIRFFATRAGYAPR